MAAIERGEEQVVDPRAERERELKEKANARMRPKKPAPPQREGSFATSGGVVGGQQL